MPASLKFAGLVFSVVGAFVALSGVPKLVDWLCGLIPGLENCDDVFWVRAAFALIFIALVSAFSFGLGADWQKKRFVRDPTDDDQSQPRTQNIIFLDSNFRGTIGGLDIRSGSSEDGDRNEGENQETKDKKED